ncbi:MAG: tRNA preQ1(34) S-adenosylmethionine ribosyltransferase-isomerase QueA [Acidimicrobiales bacterium]
MDTSRFDYELPADRIAQQPIEPREAARLLIDNGPALPPSHGTVAGLAQLLSPGDLLVVNDTRVIPARVPLKRLSGGEVELLLLEEVDPRTWQALARPSRRLRAGETLRFADSDADAGSAAGSDAGDGVTMIGSLGEGRWEVRFNGNRPVPELLEAHGRVPLPPYITAPLGDPERYQTIYARRPASVAAPTAGLHLSEPVLASLTARGVARATVELVVGLGTFRPITAERVEDHVMHEEAYRIPPETITAIRATRRAGGKIVAVGTTVMRTLETWAATAEPQGRSRLFIHRPYRFEVVDALLTNFHVPRSSLLVLVDAFIGERWQDLYAAALAQQYRFLSFGDAMLLQRSAPI